VCGASPQRTLYRCAYDEEPIRSALFALFPAPGEDELPLLADGAYVLEQCGACTLIWRFAPTGELLTRVYESWGGEGAGLERHDDLAYHRAAAEEVLLALALAGRRPGDVSVLDFGMGWGRWPRLAAAFGCRAYGVELASAQAAYAATQGVTVLALDELPDDTFDFVNSEQVFEHLVEPRETLVRLARSLAPAGWLKLNVPQTGDIVRRLERGNWAAPRRSPDSLYAVAPLEHLNCFSQKALDTLGEGAGLGRARPPASAFYAATIGVWPPRRLARGLARPPLRRVRPQAAFFRRSE
jgi:SAM-dependent methyltransferase